MKRALLVAVAGASLFSCASSKPAPPQTKVEITATPLAIIKQSVEVPKIKLPTYPAGSYVPPKFIRAYRCSYADDKTGSVVKGSFVWIKLKDAKVVASF